MAGVFVSFEGIDGCGKSTQVAAADAWLRERSLNVRLVREPGGTDLGERLRAALLDPNLGDIDPAAEALMYAAARAQVVADVIEPAIARGDVVIADRYVDSSLAYQGAGRGLGVEPIRAVNALAMRGRIPDLTILLDIDVETALARAAAVGEPDRIEQAGREFFERVCECYRELASASPERFIVVDARHEIAAVREQVLLALDTRIPGLVAT